MINTIFSENYFGPDFFSEEFRLMMGRKLEDDLIQKTGINDYRNYIHLGVNGTCAYVCDLDINGRDWRVVQRLRLSLVVRNSGIEIWVVWQMKSWNTNPIRPFNTKVNADEIDMWFENLPVKKVLEEYYQKPPQLSFDISGYSFIIEMDHFFIDSMYLKIKGKAERFEEIEELLDTRIQAWNVESEKNKRDKGVFHNSRIESKDEEFIIYYMDLGSAGEEGVQYLLDCLNEILGVESVEITSFI